MQHNTHKSSRWISKAARLALYIRDDYTCVYCAADLMDVAPAGRTLDHVVARVAGGELRSPANLVTACKHCNSSKGAKALCDWQPSAAAAVESALSQPINLEAARAILKAHKKES